MISYEPLWNTLKVKGETTYTLITRHNIDRRTIFKLKHNESVTVLTLEKLCLALDCSVQDVICISPDVSEAE
ncbi:MAG: helix-turn-helix domain-containing protein [Lachnospiraceae bacterium]